MIRWVVLTGALVLGFLLLGYDQRTDDTGVEVALILAVSLALAAAAPRMALGVALAVGLPIAVFGVLGGSWASLVALVIAGAGAFIGYAMRRAATPA